MMNAILLEELKNLSPDGWEVTETKTAAWEFYFIGHKLDQHRVREVTHVNVRVFRKTDDMLGEASAELAPTLSQPEVKKALENLWYEASLAPVPAYRLVQPAPMEAAEPVDEPIEVTARRCLEAVAAAAETAGESVNSYEIFVKRDTEHLMNSEGVDVTQQIPGMMCEVVVNARRGGHEIEIYRMIRGGLCDAPSLTKEVEAAMRVGKNRLTALPTPVTGEMPVLLSTEAVVDVCRYFLNNVGAAYIYRKMSPFEIGRPLCEKADGDAVTLRALRTLPNSSQNRVCDDEGSPVHDVELIKDGIPAHYWGGRMYAEWLGLSDAFRVTNWEVEGGAQSAAELWQGPYLEPVEFSDFQVDAMTGDIFGEIRLAWYHDGTRMIPVTGGSLSGNMREAMKQMRFSKEQKQYDCARVPQVVRFEKLTVAGAMSS